MRYGIFAFTSAKNMWIFLANLTFSFNGTEIRLYIYECLFIFVLTV